jgi:phenylalanyl-tRNA synthetase beta chain
MKVSCQWLSEYVDLDGISPDELAERLTRAGVAVDVVEKRDKGVKDVVVGYVKERTPHPDADRLGVCTVDVGQGEDLQIVCGAKNVAAGQKVPVALVGAQLPGNVKIKKAKLRGVESQGMICSARELGMNEKLLPKHQTEGILVLETDLPIGQPIHQALALDDAVLELDLTPNRADCLSMIGMAYEVAAILDKDVKLPAVGLNESGEPCPVKVTIAAEEDCTRYAARLIKGVRLGPSPLWMQNRLLAAGIRPINNVVDITNYVMMVYGQPLHAFDFAQVKSGHVVVRRAREGEVLETLDGAERILSGHMLLITDGGDVPIGLAGVMGGANSEVTDQTVDILLESARFSGTSVRLTSKALGLRSEASLRFEKGIDPNIVIPALDYAAYLMQQLAGAQVLPGIAEAKVEPVLQEISASRKIAIGVERINRFLGTDLAEEEILRIFRRLQFPAKANFGMLQVEVPTRRLDVAIEADLIEEVARLYGYDRIPTTLPVGVATPGHLTREQSLRRKLRNRLNQLGFSEAITYSLTDERRGTLLQPLNESTPIPLAMPMSEERALLRVNVLTHLLDSLQFNLNRQAEDVALFEMGKTYLTGSLPLTELPREKWELAAAATGSLAEPTWQGETKAIDFYQMKGIVEDILSILGIKDARFQPAEPKGYHPGRTARIDVNGRFAGFVGEVHPEVADLYDLQYAVVFHLDLSELLEHAQPSVDFEGLSRFPAMTRDLAIVVDRPVLASDIEAVIRHAAGGALVTLQLFDQFISEKLGANKKSLAFSLMFQQHDRTLTDEEVNEAVDRVVTALKRELGAELRA